MAAVCNTNPDPFTILVVMVAVVCVGMTTAATDTTPAVVTVRSAEFELTNWMYVLGRVMAAGPAEDVVSVNFPCACWYMAELPIKLRTTSFWLLPASIGKGTEAGVNAVTDTTVYENVALVRMELLPVPTWVMAVKVAVPGPTASTCWVQPEPHIDTTVKTLVLLLTNTVRASLSPDVWTVGLTKFRAMVNVRDVG